MVQTASSPALPSRKTVSRANSILSGNTGVGAQPFTQSRSPSGLKSGKATSALHGSSKLPARLICRAVLCEKRVLVRAMTQPRENHLENNHENSSLDRQRRPPTEDRRSTHRRLTCFACRNRPGRCGVDGQIADVVFTVQHVNNNRQNKNPHQKPAAAHRSSRNQQENRPDISPHPSTSRTRSGMCVLAKSCLADGITNNAASIKITRPNVHCNPVRAVFIRCSVTAVPRAVRFVSGAPSGVPFEIRIRARLQARRLRFV